MRRIRGVTLIELLVCIAIVVVLAALIFGGRENWGSGGEHDVPVYEQPHEMSTPDGEVYDTVFPEDEG